MISPTEAPAPSNGRDDRGRFTRSNPGGPGNPFARQVAQLRQVLLDCVTPGDMAAIAHKLLELAKAGNVQAIKLLFSYTMGRPAAAEQPDQLDVQEWQLLQQTASMAAELPEVIATPDPSLPLQLVRAARPAVALDMSRQMSETFRAGEEQEQKRQEQRERRRQEANRLRQSQDQKTPSVNGRNGQAAVVQERVVDPQMQQLLEARAALDSQALRELESAVQDCPPVAQAPPSTIGCNGRRGPAAADEPTEKNEAGLRNCASNHALMGREESGTVP
jgi:hypothetical protein